MPLDCNTVTSCQTFAFILQLISRCLILKETYLLYWLQYITTKQNNLNIAFYLYTKLFSNVPHFPSNNSILTV